ncbi:hypothetical protein V2J09_018086 [Rumex salicifolius]
MASGWDNFTEFGNIAQLAGLNAVALIGLIVKAANSARLHKTNCKQFAQHLKLIGNLLEQLKISELKRYPETREPLELLEDALRRAYLLVQSCQERSYLYLLAMGWNIVYQFRRSQEEIDRYLRIMPLVSLVSNARFKERLEYISRDQREYTLDEEERKVHVAVLNQEPSKADTVVLKKNLSRSYPNLPFEKVLQKETEKLQEELQRSQSLNNPQQCEVILHLMEVTETAVRHSRNLGEDHLHCHERQGLAVDKSCPGGNNDTSASPRVYYKESNLEEEWHTDLLDCCQEPKLCIGTFCFPCGTFSRIASVAKNQPMSPGEACNELLAYSLVLSCCCYTCCIRKRLRNMLNVKGGLCDDFLSHLICCCCSLVQEWREIQIRGVKGHSRTSFDVPSLILSTYVPPMAINQVK